MLTMTDVTPNLFRRKMTWRMMQTVEKKLEEFHAAGIHDNGGAMKAGMLDLAAKAAELAGEPDVAKRFASERDRMIELINTTPPMRRRKGKGKK